MRLVPAAAGRGPNLVLVHGWGLGPRAWEPLLPHLGRYTVHIAALPGYAASPPMPGAGLDSLADALAEALPPTAIVCGWSLGAMLALNCAARHAGRITRLVLVGANARFVAAPDWPEALPVIELEDFAAALATDPAALLQRFSLLIQRGDARGRAAGRALAGCLADGPPADAATLGAGLDMLRHADLRREAARVAAPTLLLHGAADTLMPPAGAARLAALLPNARLELLAAAGHAPFASDPAGFATRLTTFAGSAA